MKILSLNIWGGKLGKQIVELLKNEDADVVCLQEAVEFKGGRCFLLEDLDAIVEKTGYEHHHFHPNVGYNLMKRKADMGLAILSKFPITDSEAQYLRLEYADNFDFIDTDYNVQSLQRVTIESNGKKYHILNYHGHHVDGHKNGNEETLRQCNLIKEEVEKLQENVVLCGDFNLAPDSESIKLISSVLRNNTTESGVETTRTNLTKKTEVCDYVFTSPEIEVKSFKVLDEVASDHKALSMEI